MMKSLFDGISAEARDMARGICKEWKFTNQERVLFRQALENFDQMREAQRLIKADGLVLEDKMGRKYLHPACVVEKVAKNNFMRLIRAIGFEKALKEAQKAKKQAQ